MYRIWDFCDGENEDAIFWIVKLWGMIEFYWRFRVILGGVTFCEVVTSLELNVINDN
jgi:hypothetical protein